MSCGFPPTGGSKGSIAYHQQPDRCHYSGWSCKVKDGWELIRVHCRKREMRLIYRSAA